MEPSPAIRERLLELARDAALVAELIEAEPSLYAHVLGGDIARIRASEGSLLVLDRASEQLRFVVAVGASAERLRGLQQPLSSGLTSFAVWSNRPICCNNVQQDPRHDRRISEITGAPTYSLLAVPVTVVGETVGALTAVNKCRAAGSPELDAEGFDGDDLQLYSLTARVCGAILTGQLMERTEG